MLQKILVPLLVFVVVLVALTFGETIGREALVWIQHLTGMVFHDLADIYYALHAYFSRHSTKIIIALLITLPVSFWLLRNQGQAIARTSPRKVAIVLAVFLGWLGVHRFYRGQVGWGLFYLFLLWFFAPLVVVIALIDAVRYLFMSDEEFAAAP